MKKLLLLFAACVSLAWTEGDVFSERFHGGLVIWEMDKDVHLYRSAAKASLLFTISESEKEDLHYSITILAKEDSVVKVRADPMPYYDNVSLEGWSEISNFAINVGARSSGNGSSKIELYADPDEQSRKWEVWDIPDGPQQIFDLSGKWVKIKIEDGKGKVHTGWLPPKYQCHNPFGGCT